MKEDTVRIAGKIRHSSVNGPGVRYVVFFQGCPHKCKGCQNPETHDPFSGEEVYISELTDEIRNTRYIDGITISGGEPLMQPHAVKKLAEASHLAGLDVWLYTGWTFEEIMFDDTAEEVKNTLEDLDVLVDGRFVESLKSQGSLYRGSSNQRIIDVPASLDRGNVIQLDL